MVFMLPILRPKAAGKGSLASLALLLCEGVIWTVADPASSSYTDNLRWLL